MNSFPYLEPVFDNKTAICFCCDQNYFPYLNVAVQSVVDQASDDFGYDIVILCSGISKEEQKEFCSSYNRKNISVRFLDVWSIVEYFGRDTFVPANWFRSVATYYRIFVPNVLKNHVQVVYSDVDAIFIENVKRLCLVDVGDNLFAAVKSAVKLARLEKIWPGVTEKYKKMGIYDRDNNYFAAGLLVFNIKKCLEFDFLNKCIKKLIEIAPYVTACDQDLLNALCQGKITSLLKNGETVYNNEFVINFSKKPWSNTTIPFAHKWWQYARKSNMFYEKIILEKLVYPKTNNLEKQAKGLNLKILELQNENNILKTKITNLQNKSNPIQISATKRVQNYLSYKLGVAMIENSKSIFGYIKMPFVLWSIKKEHKITQKINEILSLPKIESLPDYKEALKLKNHLSYKLGQALIKATKFWFCGGYIWLIFEIQKIKKNHKK